MINSADNKFLICTNGNSDKFYRMIFDPVRNNFIVEYGSNKSPNNFRSATYNYAVWMAKYNEKLKKGYKDVSNTYDFEPDLKRLGITKNTISDELIFSLKLYNDNYFTIETINGEIKVMSYKKKNDKAIKNEVNKNMLFEIKNASHLNVISWGEIREGNLGKVKSNISLLSDEDKEILDVAEKLIRSYIILTPF